MFVLGMSPGALWAQSPWTIGETGTTENLWGMAYRPQRSGEEGAGRLVVVGERGTILTSNDEGVTWTRRESGTNLWLTAVADNSTLNRFFVVGEGGLILSSPDGVSWTRESSPTTVRLNGIGRSAVASNSMWATGEAGVGLLSRDIQGNWTQSDPGFGDRWLRGLMPSSGEIAVGQGGAIFRALRDDSTNPPAVTWQVVPAPVTSDLEAVAQGSFFQGPAPVMVGADGTILQGRGASWVARTSGTTQRLRGVCWKEGGSVTLITLASVRSVGEFFAVGTHGTLLRSADGETWAADAGPTQNNLNAVGATKDFVIAVGDGGMLLRTGGSRSQPVITQHPTTDTDASGEVFAHAAAAGDGRMTYIWVQLSAGAPYPVGSESLRQSLARAPFGTFGSAFQLLVGNAFGITRSATFTPNRFLNLAARAIVGSADNALIGGFAVSGRETPRLRTMLIRAVGPGLSPLGVANAIAAPRLSVYAGSRLVAANERWETNANADEIRATAQRVGAFPLAAGSADSAVLLSMERGNYTAHVESANGSTGVALVEIYDADEPNLSRLTNLSSRAQVQDGSGVLIGGLVIEGGVRKTVLLRASGPTLATFGLLGSLTQPILSLFKDGAVVATASRWSQEANAAQIKATADTVNAFPFPDGSADSAMLLQLDPGTYTVQVTGADGGTGLALVEIYDAP